VLQEMATVLASSLATDGNASPSWESENVDAQSLKSKLKVIDLESHQRPSKLTSEDVQSLRELQLRILRLLGRQAHHNKSIFSRRWIEGIIGFLYTEPSAKEA
ncbi:hypothetical protein BGZ65_001894, partial [Modicella reniformis]